jgi:hypothetical protein
MSRLAGLVLCGVESAWMVLPFLKGLFVLTGRSLLEFLFVMSLAMPFVAMVLAFAAAKRAAKWLLCFAGIQALFIVVATVRAYIQGRWPLLSPDVSVVVRLMLLPVLNGGLTSGGV